MNSITNLLSAELTYALGWTFIHTLWQGCLLMVLLLIVQKVFKLSSSGRYWSALIAMSILLVTSILTLSLFLNSSNVIASMSSSSLLVISNFDGLQDFQTLSFLEQYLPAIAWCWVIGAAFYAIKLCGGFTQVYRLKSKGIISIPNNWQHRFDQLLIRTKIDKSVRLLQSSKVSVSMVLGYFKPVVLLPLGMISGLSADQVEAILLHELSHIKRHDYLVNVIQSIIEVIFYYHPVVWWLSTQIRKEREHCCDDQIIAQGVDKLTYVHALTNVRTIILTQNKLTMGLANNKNDLLNRIKRLVEGKDQSSTNFYSKGIPLIVLITVLMSFSWYQKEQLPKELEKNTSLKELDSTSPLREVPMFRTPPKDTVIIDKLLPTTSTTSKTTIIWTDDDGVVHEIIQDTDTDTDSDSDNNWEVLEDHLNNAEFDIDLGRIVEELSEIHDLNIDIATDFDQSFDFHFDSDLDTLPEVHREQMRRIEEELARAKESINNVRFDFREDRELTQEQKEKMKKEMRAMELNLRKMELLNNFEFHDRKEREGKGDRDQLRDLRHKERESQQREFRTQHEEFSTQRMEQKMQVIEQELEKREKELEKREEEMEAWEKNYEVYQKALIKELKSDGYLGKGEKLKNFEMSDDQIKVNGKTIDSKDLKKYQELKSKHLDK